MKLIRKMSSIVVTIAFVLLSISGCDSSSNNLSRDTAKSLIKEAAKLEPASIAFYPGKASEAMYARESIHKCGFNSIAGLKNEKAILHDWEKKGLITITKTSREVAPVFGGQEFWEICSLTDKGKNDVYLSRETVINIFGSQEEILIKIADRVILDVTGIKINESGTNAIAYFTYKAESNTAGESLNAEPGLHDYYLDLLSSDIREGSAQLALYDDGWRIEDLKFDGEFVSGRSKQQPRDDPNRRHSDTSITDNIEEPRKSIDESSIATVSASADNKKKVSIEEKYIGTWLSDNRKYFIELTDSRAVFYNRDWSANLKITKDLILNIVGSNDVAFDLTSEDMHSFYIKIDREAPSLLVPVSILSHMKNFYVYQDNRKINDMRFSKIPVFSRESLVGKWFSIVTSDDFLMSDIIEISENSISSENVIVDKKENTAELFSDNLEFRYGFLLVYKEDSDGPEMSAVVTDVQPEKLTLLHPSDSASGLNEREYVPYTGQSHVSKSDADVSDIVDLNQSRQRIVRELLQAYKNNLDTINLVADNADYSVLAWAAYGGTDALDLAKQRGWTPFRSIEKNNYFKGGNAIATLFVSDKGKSVLAFRGTDPLNPGDWYTNIKGTLSPNDLDNKQIDGAREIALEIATQHDNVVFVGHSLGGRMAQVARLATGKAAVTFNTAPLGVNDRQKALANATEPKASITSFKSPEDPLSSLFSPSDVEISNIVSVNGGALTDAVNADYTHSMEVIARAMQDVRHARDEGWIEAYLAKEH